MLFSGALPSSTGFGEKEAHRHYLNCLYTQVSSSTRNTYEETQNAHLLLLDTAEQLLRGLRAKEIRGQDRDFIEIFDANRAAIAVFQSAYGVVLSKEWNKIVR